LWFPLSYNTVYVVSTFGPLWCSKTSDKVKKRLKSKTKAEYVNSLRQGVGNEESKIETKSGSLRDFILIKVGRKSNFWSKKKKKKNNLQLTSSKSFTIKASKWTGTVVCKWKVSIFFKKKNELDFFLKWERLKKDNFNCSKLIL